MDRLVLKRALQTPRLLRSSPTTQPALRVAATARAISAVPRIAERSFWKSMLPKAWRRENRPVQDVAAPKKSWLAKEWNPATFFGLIFLLIGSMSIQMILLRRTFDAHTRRSDVRIGLLREVVEKLQNGEEVDVEKVLGTGDPEKEAIWDEVLNEIEKDSAVRNQKKQEKARTPEPSPSSTAKTASAESAPAGEKPKAQAAYFF